MRNLLLSGIALGVLVTPVMAADLAPSFKAPIPVYTWTGCYVGADIGGGWANQASQQKLNAQLTSTWWRRIAASERTWKSAQPSWSLTCL